MFTKMMRLGRDATLRTVGDNKVANLSLAYDYGLKDKATGKRQTQWVDAAFWGKGAEAVIDYLVQGKQVCVTLDDVHIEEYEDKDGYMRPKLVGRVVALELGGGGEDRKNTSGQAGSAGGGQRRPAGPAPAPRAPAPAPKASGGFDDMDDDSIPF